MKPSTLLPRLTTSGAKRTSSTTHPSTRAVALACAALLAGSLALLGQDARAALVSFDSLVADNAGIAGDGMVYESAGLRFTTDGTQPDALVHWGANDATNADPGGATLLANHPGNHLIVRPAAGGSFTLESFDMADAYNAGIAGLLVYQYIDDFGDHGGFLHLDDEVGMQTVAFARSGVRELRFWQLEPYLQIDNIRFSIDATDEPASLPEPGSAALLAAAALALTLHRRGPVATSARGRA